jgi:hypothetical protein
MPDHEEDAAVNYRLLALLCLTAAVPAFPISAAANAYRWVDEDGHVHYSDQLPPQVVDRAYSVINKDGITVNNVERAKTAQERAEEQRRAQQRAEQERLARQQAEYDHILLDTYTKVSDLEQTRDRYIASLEGAIKVAQHKLTNLTDDITKLRTAAANLEREGRPVPEDMSKDIASLQTQIDRENAFIQEQRNQQQEVRSKFAADIARYQELKAEQRRADSK